ncbi:MAG: flavin reductase family protein, partial [Mesorhizobium sp.]|nr:flavin reductase family protein [Mesorhizobium sp.]
FSERETCFQKNSISICANWTDGARRYGWRPVQARSWRWMDYSAPVLREAVVNLDCRVADIIAFSTHDLFVGAVEAVHRHDPTQPFI